jgi:EAL domain-containing protein (putative c-di-GMP-specific phosphodiesterase class I)
VAVNLSVRDLVDLDLPGAIAAELDRCGLEPRSLGIEITETMLVLDPNRTIEVLARLQEMGVHISLDDFGTGYSSLSYLQRLPVDELKIDRRSSATSPGARPTRASSRPRSPSRGASA